MPLRDHFHPPLSRRHRWDSLHGQWPAMIVIDLNRRISSQYVAEPRIHLGMSFEIEIGALDTDPPLPPEILSTGTDAGGGTATAAWAPPRPTLAVDTELPEPDEYEVRVYDEEGQRLVAAIEIVSPANKDRPDHRQTFVAKCAALLQRGVSVTIVDPVTARRPNLYADLLDLLGQSDPALSPAAPTVYAVACRWRSGGGAGRLETWAHPLAVGQGLPTLPLWVAPDLAVPLDLESTYEETCRILRIG